MHKINECKNCDTFRDHISDSTLELLAGRIDIALGCYSKMYGYFKSTNIVDGLLRGFKGTEECANSHEKMESLLKEYIIERKVRFCEIIDEEVCQNDGKDITGFLHIASLFGALAELMERANREFEKQFTEQNGTPPPNKINLEKIAPGTSVH